MRQAKRWNVRLKDSKKPVAINGRFDEWQTLRHTSTFEEVERFIAENSERLEGFAFVVNPGDKHSDDLIWLCLDFDRGIDPETGKPWPWIQTLVDVFDTYVEYSRSGKGLHLFLLVRSAPIIGMGQKPMIVDSQEQGAIEAIANGQIAVTGNVYGPQREVAIIDVSDLGIIPFFNARFKENEDGSDNSEIWSGDSELSPELEPLRDEMENWTAANKDPNDPCDSSNIALAAACHSLRKGCNGYQVFDLLKNGPCNESRMTGPLWTDDEIKRKVNEAYKKVAANGTYNTEAVMTNDGSEFQDTANEPGVFDNIPEEPTEEEFDTPPPMDLAAFDSFIGQYILETDEYTEANKHARLLDMLVKSACYFGRAAYAMFSARVVRLILFAVLVGKTSSGRKGEAAVEGDLVFEGLIPNVIRDFSSGPALIGTMADPETETDEMGCNVIQPFDNRWLLECEEFVNVLIAASRDGSTFSGNLRMAFDGKTLESRVRKETLRATLYLLCIMGHITPEEIMSRLPSSEKTNGYVNRFLWCPSKREKRINEFRLSVEIRRQNAEFKRRKAEETRDKLETTYKWLLSRHSEGEIEATIHGTEIDFDQSGLDSMADFQDEFDNYLDHCGHDTLIARGSPLVLRLALLTAILHRSEVITARHVATAKAIWRYCQDGVVLIFKPSSRSREVVSQTTLESLYQWLATKGPVTKRDIQQYGPIALRPAKTLDPALRILVKQGRGEWSESRQNPNGGPPVHYFILK